MAKDKQENRTSSAHYSSQRFKDQDAAPEEERAAEATVPRKRGRPPKAYPAQNQYRSF